ILGPRGTGALGVGEAAGLGAGSGNSSAGEMAGAGAADASTRALLNAPASAILRSCMGHWLKRTTSPAVTQIQRPPVPGEGARGQFAQPIRGIHVSFTDSPPPLTKHERSAAAARR